MQSRSSTWRGSVRAVEIDIQRAADRISPYERLEKAIADDSWNSPSARLGRGLSEKDDCQSGVIVQPLPPSEEGSDDLVGAHLGPMIGGGRVDKNHVRASIRTSIFHGTSRMLHEGQKPRPGDLTKITDLPAGRRQKLEALLDEAVAMIAEADPHTASLVRRVNLISVNPLPAKLAGRASDLFAMFRANDEGKWNEFVTKLTDESDPDSELNWHALGSVARTYERQWRASFQNGNKELRTHARQNLFRIARALLEHWKPGDDEATFNKKAMPVLATCILGLMGKTKTGKGLHTDDQMTLDFWLREHANGNDMGNLRIGDFDFAKEGGFSPEAVAVINDEVYNHFVQKYDEIRARSGAKTPAGGSAVPKSKFIYYAHDETAVVGWQVSRPSRMRLAVYISEGMLDALLGDDDTPGNPLALAEILIEEVGAHLDENRAPLSLEEEELVGQQKRATLIQKWGRNTSLPGGGRPDMPLMLKDIVPEAGGQTPPSNDPNN